MTNIKSIAIFEPVGGHGGMDYYDYGLAEGLSNAGLSVHLYTCNETQERPSPNVSTHLSFGEVWKKKGLAKIYAFYKGYWKSFRDARSHSISTFHFHFFQIGWINFFVLVLAACFRSKRIVTVHDVDPFNHKSWKHIHRLCDFFIHGYIVHNHFSHTELVSKHISTNKIRVIPHGNYLPFIEPVAPQKKENGRFDLLFFGQIKEVKGLDILLNALAIARDKNPSIHLTIAGKPWHTSKEKIEEQIRHLQLTEVVHPLFTYIPNNEIAGFFERCDLIVLPYKRIYQSGVLLLAMSYGKPCLTSDLDPFKEVISDGENGFLFPSENAEALAEKIVSIASQRDQLVFVQKKARIQLIQEYNWDEIAKTTQALYSSIH